MRRSLLSKIHYFLGVAALLGLGTVAAVSGPLAQAVAPPTMSSVGLDINAAGNLYAWGNFSQNGSGTFSTGSGTVSLNGNATASGSLSVHGNTTLGDASSDTVTVNASSVAVPNDLSIDSGTLYVDAINHRIGIGTGSPISALAVNGDAYVSNIQRIGGDIIVHSDTLVTSSGKVGIGTATPGATLDVNGEGICTPRAAPPSRATSASAILTSTCCASPPIPAAAPIPAS
jgi:hypothetical protein